MGKIRNLVNKLRQSTSGNATLLLALGTPMLVGGTGLAVDTAQWYLWKRELQFAVDQSAIAAAWARSIDETGNSYVSRGKQEYENNLSLVADFDSGPTITLENYDGGINNSIQVVASATNTLPFSSFLTGGSATVSASARTIFEPGAVYNPCMLALDPTAAQAMFLNGNVTVTATCGIGALSNSKSAVVKDGESGSVDVGFVITGGEIVDVHGHFDDEDKVENSRDLKDPYEGLTPPDNATPQTLSCPKGKAVYTADETAFIETTFSYFKGKNRNSLTSISYPGGRSTETSNSTEYGKEFNSAPSDWSETGKTTYVEIAGGGNDKIWEASTTTTKLTYTNIVAPTTGVASAQPGTYTDFTIKCDTVLASGVYVLDGATFGLQGQHNVTGTGVMIVLKNGAGIQLSGGSDIHLSAMNKSQLIAAGVPSSDVEKMLGMLIFEDPKSPGSKNSHLTGTSTQIFDGIIYLPNSELKIAGTPEGKSQCMVIATKTLQFAGNVDVTSLCPTGADPKGAVAEVKDRVLLVG